MDPENPQDRPESTSTLEDESVEALGARLAGMTSAELSETLAGLSRVARAELLAWLGSEELADLLERLPEVQAQDLFEELPSEEAAGVLQQLPSDEQADLVSHLEPDEAEDILEQLPAESAENVRRLAEYDEDVAGGIMVTEFIALRPEATVREVLANLDSAAENFRDMQVQYAYVTDEAGRLVGVLPLRDLLFARRPAPVSSCMLPDPLSIRDDAPLTDLREFFSSHHFLGVPVVDAEGTLLGVVHKTSVAEAAEHRAEIEHLRSQGIVGEELRSMPLIRRSSRRLAWLSANVGLNVAAASVIASHQDTLQAAIALAVFLPMISDMSGCSGNQAVAVSMRELTLGLIHPRDGLRVWAKELGVGAINGIALGGLAGLAAGLWTGSPWLGVVVGSALAANTLIAVSVGGCLPLALRGMGLDPALASGPILTTVTDVCGFLIALSLAAALLGQL